MKHKRMIVLVLLIIFISICTFSIYTNTHEEKVNYVALGDSLTAGRNPYGSDDYGYADYIKDYLNTKGKLNSYKNYAVSGYLVSDVIDDINYNRAVEIEEATIGLKKALRESDLVTISVGANDLLKGVSLSNYADLFSDRVVAMNKIDNIIERVEDLLVLVKKYAKGDILVIGYYNPFPRLTKYKSRIDEIVIYADDKYIELCDELDIYYIKISDVLADNYEFLPNPIDIHPSKQGYEAISNRIIETIELKLLN